MQKRREELRKERSENVSLDVRDERETRAVGGASFTRSFDIDKITQIGWFRFMEKILSYSNFALYALFNL